MFVGVINGPTEARSHPATAQHMRLALPLRALLLAAYASGLQFAQRAPAVARSREVVMMGRKFENNKLKMAKTALAYAKKVCRMCRAPAIRPAHEPGALALRRRPTSARRS